MCWGLETDLRFLFLSVTPVYLCCCSIYCCCIWQGLLFISFFWYCVWLSICVFGVKIICCLSFVFLVSFCLDNLSKIKVCTTITDYIISSLDFSFCNNDLSFPVKFERCFFHNFRKVKWFVLNFLSTSLFFNLKWITRIPKNFWELLSLLLIHSYFEHVILL